MNVLSLFDGMSGGMLACQKADIKIDNYYASEIKPHAIKTSMANFPSIKRLGDINNVHYLEGGLFSENGMYAPGQIDLFIGGSPCQDLSFINQKKAGLEGEKSKLFYQYFRLLNEVKPKYFLLENVASMDNESRDVISKLLGVEPIMINSNLLSPQNRRRYYWTNIPNVTQPQDKQIMLLDIIDKEAEAEEALSQKHIEFIEKKRNTGLYVQVNGDKSMPITRRGFAAWNTQYYEDEKGIRNLTLLEYMRLQTIPEWFVFPVSKTKATDLIGDGWTIDVIAHILSFI